MPILNKRQPRFVRFDQTPYRTGIPPIFCYNFLNQFPPLIRLPVSRMRHRKFGTVWPSMKSLQSSRMNRHSGERSWLSWWGINGRLRLSWSCWLNRHRYPLMEETFTGIANSRHKLCSSGSRDNGRKCGLGPDGSIPICSAKAHPYWSSGEDKARIFQSCS